MVSGGTLFVIASPLGNLKDLSIRATEVLKRVDLVAAEDTRRARILLSHVGASAKVESFHAHSSEKKLERLLRALDQGKAVALLSDAGTPTISDPGALLIRRARDSSHKIVPLPGPSAVVAALSVSGFAADRYTFLGFLPRKGRERSRLLEIAAGSTWPIVLFESPLRLVKLLEDLAQRCGPDRGVVVARELTKIHEEVRSGTLSALTVYYLENRPRGEVTVLLSGARPAATTVDEAEVRKRALSLLRSGETRKTVAATLAKELKAPRNRIYNIVSEL